MPQDLAETPTAVAAHPAAPPAPSAPPPTPPDDVTMVSTRDGRRLSVSEWGKRDGTAVFVLHGTPGSRVGVAPRPSVLYRQGIRLVAYDRPGYGWSDPVPKRQVVDAAQDVEDIAKALDIGRFAVVGRSGGGPHALACAAALGDRVTRAAALVSLAPRIGSDGMQDEWYTGMGQGNTDEYRRAEQGYETLAESLRDRATQIHLDPGKLLDQLLSEVQDSDLQVIADAGIRRILKDNYKEALQQQGAGWIDDAYSFAHDWGFRLAEVTTKVLLWHGSEDVFSPISHSLWLRKMLPDSELRTESGAAHFDAIARLPNVLSWLTRPEAPECD
ncbi:alpha/beta fold hydrolase [Streptacidiphilus sp. N1-12]|uniref:Alpha/beta fold hydrolase n=2 Tax=Streptacidiphilus alkalitolerans TaxID=3342712 RepID=A0ABV6V6K0_9ACTN